ncbi:MAG: hypothetical protein A2857_04065 [Candidatus Levybacteria bacterium RIFCSPHIGHO2_01_FULL_36_15]|nr:MAG: hypothetical protein A2857_04065 [Candidatus Levybacteria bacterium RIFCSPHIGHO2_01_FULL_36_15]OGH37441.1 MAG: hypothetical protein A2905_04890 [Candidatus Levybacteria bacterium RIFCSPLOWO2_01_FULL_36_10]
MGVYIPFIAAVVCIFPLAIFIYRGILRYNSLREIFITILGFVVPCMPLIFFNLTNHWDTVQGIYKTAIYSKNSIYVANSWSIYLKSFWPELWAVTLGVLKILGTGLALAFLVVLSIKGYQKKLPKPLIFLLITFFFNFILLRYYWGDRHVVYFSYLHPFIFIFSAYVFFLSLLIPT